MRSASATTRAATATKATPRPAVPGLMAKADFFLDLLARPGRGPTESVRISARSGIDAAVPGSGQTIGIDSLLDARSRSPWRIWPTAVASQGRSEGDLAMSPTTNSSRALGISSTFLLGRGGGSLMCMCIITTAEVPANGVSPVSI